MNASREQQQELLKRRLGPVIGAALNDPHVTEVMANPDGKLWVYQEGRHCDTGVTLTQSMREAVIASVAAVLGVSVNEHYPSVKGELPFSKHRFQGELPPVSEEPMFVIRKHLLKEVRLDDYVTAGSMDYWQAHYLQSAVRRGDAIIISGETGSGKTTLASALLAELVSCDHDSSLRVAILEDTRELHCPIPNSFRLRSGHGKTLRDLVRDTLRLFPSRIIIGEVMGPEALDLLKAWNTGHKGGLATVHANSVADVYDRLAMLVEEAGVTLSRSLFARAVSLLVHIAADGDTRRVTEIARVCRVGNDFTIVPVRKENETNSVA